MDWGTIKDELITTEERMEASGLVVRLGGSLSYRIDEETIYYAGGDLRDHGLLPEDIRRVRIKRAHGLSGIHSAIYRARPDIKSVVFTRQCFGSALGILDQERLAAEDASGERVKILVVPFTLPGSDAQRSHVYRLAARDKAAGFLIAANHGVFAYGESPEDAFASTVTLERFARLYFKELGATSIPFHVVEGFGSRRDGKGIAYEQPDTPARVRQIHEQIYTARPDVTEVVHNVSEAARMVSRLNEKLFAYYDDFVELVGSSLEVPLGQSGTDGRDAVRIRKGAQACFCYDDGVYCFGTREQPAAYTAQSVEKACVTQIAVQRMGGANVLSPRDVRRIGGRR